MKKILLLKTIVCCVLLILAGFIIKFLIDDFNTVISYNKLIANYSEAGNFTIVTDLKIFKSKIILRIVIQLLVVITLFTGIVYMWLEKRFFSDLKNIIYEKHKQHFIVKEEKKQAKLEFKKNRLKAKLSKLEEQNKKDT